MVWCWVALLARLSSDFQERDRRRALTGACEHSVARSARNRLVSAPQGKVEIVIESTGWSEGLLVVTRLAVGHTPAGMGILVARDTFLIEAEIGASPRTCGPRGLDRPGELGRVAFLAGQPPMRAIEEIVDVRVVEGVRL